MVSETGSRCWTLQVKVGIRVSRGGNVLKPAHFTAEPNSKLDPGKYVNVVGPCISNQSPEWISLSLFQKTGQIDQSNRCLLWGIDKDRTFSPRAFIRVLTVCSFLLRNEFAHREWETDCITDY